MPNRLASEQSPYLLQHKDNPVDWYSWGDEAFERARREDRPIFLSIGYSTCHWCHVMEHESFENSDVAHVLNRHFVSIKVDREERPDVDRVYMTFVQATTGSGGWPMSVWLTPQLQPFYGGTYFPPTSRWGKPGFVQVLEEIARVWHDERDKVQGSASSIVERLRSFGRSSGGGSVPGPEVLAKTVRDFASAFDGRRGGFGDAPKFPRPSELLFLMREFARTGDGDARDMALVTLRAMALGGMRDHIGGGFHRYSVDGDWRVPHFEKMLYDQAQLVLAYLEAAQITHDPFYSGVAADTLEYVLRDLADPAGGFFSAEDADSTPPEAVGASQSRSTHGRPPHKMEGAFYIWRDDEIGELLGEDADVFRARFGVQPDGNAPSDPQNEFSGKNLLYTARPLEEVARMSGRTPGEVEAALARARATLLERRAARPRPHLDDKVLTAWNGLMIAAFARAARVLDDGERYLHAARRAATFVRARLWNGQDGRLLRRYRQGNASVDAYAEDYACLIFGLLELFQAEGDPQWLAWARELQARQDELFWDDAEGGWFSTTGRDPSVLLRLKEDYDGAEPAASSVSALNVLTLSHLFDNAVLADRLARTFSAFGERAAQLGRAMPMMLTALSTYHAGVAQVVMAGDLASPEGRSLVEPLRQTYLPGTIVIRAVPRHHAALVELLPWTAAMPAREDRPTAYVCRDFACEAPTTSPEQVQVLLNGRSR